MVPVNEFSRIFAVDDLPEDGREVHLQAKPLEREALARRFGILRLDSVLADARLERAESAVRVSGRVEADVVQTCVVSLEPVATHIAENFVVLFERPDAPGLAERVHLIDPDEEDLEVLASSAIDVGEVVAEQLALALPPYPRKPGAEFRAYSTDRGGEKRAEKPVAPFSGLDKLLRKQ